MIVFSCESCCHGKNHKSAFPKSGIKTKTEPFELIHSDVCGKIDPVSEGGGNYFVTFIDDSTRYVWINVIKNKSDVLQCFKNWKTMVEKQYNTKVKWLRSDDGGESTSIEFENYLTSEGIVHEKTIPHTPEQNGLAERMNRTLIEQIRSMIADSNVSKTLWAEAINTACYVRNRSPAAALNNLTPYEALNNRKPNVKHLRVFGCTGYVYIPKEKRAKLDSTSLKCVFVGYGAAIIGYRMYNPANSNIVFSRNVIFDESHPVHFHKETDNVVTEPISISVNDLNSNIETSSTDDCTDTDNFVSSNSITNSGVELRKSKRNVKIPARLGEWVYSSISQSSIPKTVSEASNSSEFASWKEAMQREIDSLNQNNVWTLSKTTNGKQPINTKWIFKKKIGPDGSTHSYKARLVAQGFSQRPGLDYDETFAPVMRIESVRTILVLSAKHTLQVHQMDVSSAFLKGVVDEELYLTQPEGFVQTSSEQIFCKLNKAIYGLKQAPKCWICA